MAALIGSQPNVSSCVSAVNKGKGVVSKLNSDSLEIGRLNRSVVHSSVVADNGDRGSLQSLYSQVGFGVQRGLRFRWTDEHSVIRVDPRGNGGRVRATVAPQADFGARPEPKLTYIPLKVIDSEVEFDRVLSEARERNEPIIVDWMASWCRKCLYLKPKLEKLAAYFHPYIKFYYVDVNNVPQSMVKRAQVTQMPTIQLWRNGAQEAEVIGGQQANTVVDQVKDMIAKGNPTG